MTSRRITNTIVIALLFAATAVSAAAPLKVLIIDGHNNHNWAQTTPVMQKILADTGRFAVEVATAPKNKSKIAEFKPDFGKYDVVVSNYNGPEWSAETKAAFVTYMKSGGGLVIVHAADNSFPKWPEYNEMIGLGGWGGRNEKSGPLIRYRDGKIVRDTKPGRAGGHGPQVEYTVDTRDPKHPIMAGLPTKWMHAKDELYSRLRGPAKNLTVLATSLSRSTKEHEPTLFTVNYGKGRMFHTVLGHAASQMHCVGFIVTLQRGTEWAATGKVTLTKVPADFPTAEKSSVRKPVPAKTIEKKPAKGK